MHEQAVGAIEASQWRRAADPATAAATGDPGMPPYQVVRALVAVEAGDWTAAERAFESASTVDDLPESWIGLALARLELGEPQQDVVAALASADRVAGQDPDILLARAAILMRLGRVTEADDALADLLAGLPSLAADPAWREDPLLAGRFASVLAMAMERTAVPWELALMAGHAELAQEMVTRSGLDIAELVAPAWQGDARAAAMLIDAALADPRDDEVVSWAARVAARHGEIEMAGRLRRILGFDYEGSGQPGYEARIDFGRNAATPGAIAPLHQYGRNVYRRATPGRLLPPGLPGIVMVDLARTPGATVAVLTTSGR
jgi:tetratricopeptide (TPR) repeat protein